MDGNAGEEELSSPGVSCSICLDLVSDNGGRSWAKLQCGHEFHLDCIGSAFNMKGAMQCPNCRKVEKGQWLYANGTARRIHDLTMDDWIPDEDFYELSYPEVPYQVHWCPFGELDRVGSSFEELEPPSSTYHDLRRLHSVYGEPAAVPSMTQSYIAYTGPMPPSLSRAIDNTEAPNFRHQWSGLSGQGEVISHHAFPTVSAQYHRPGHHSSHFPAPSSHPNGSDGVPAPLRPSDEYDTRPRSTISAHAALFGHGSGPTSGNPFLSSTAPHHLISNSRIRERIQVSYAFNPWQLSGSSPLSRWPDIHGIRRLHAPRPARHNHSGSFYLIPPGSSGPSLHGADFPLPNYFNPWERGHLSDFQHLSFGMDSGWSSFEFRRGTGAVGPGDRMSSSWHRLPS